MLKFLIFSLISLGTVNMFELDHFMAMLYPIDDQNLTMKECLPLIAKFCLPGDHSRILPLDDEIEARKQLALLVNNDTKWVHQMFMIGLDTVDHLSEMDLCKPSKKMDKDDVGILKMLVFINEMDKYDAEAKKLRDRFLNVLNEVQKPDTNIKMKDLECMLREYSQHIADVYPKTDGLQNFVEKIVKKAFKHIMKILESAGGRAAKHCKLPEQGAGPNQKYQSLMLPFFLATHNLMKRDV